jgi:tetratricopeptide (TPR) repeat protein
MRRALLHGLALACLTLWVPGWVSPAYAASMPARIVEAARTAEAAYADGDYPRAIAAYREVLNAGYFSGSLYYDLGSACHRSGEQGWAIAYLEEARRLSPRDADIRHNLALARGGARADAPQLQTSWLLDLLASLLDAAAPFEVMRGLLIAVWAAALTGAAVAWLPDGSLRRGLRRVAFVALIAVGLAAAGLALKAYQVHSAASGVVVADETEVRSGPLASETVQFVLHGGTLVHLGRNTGAWRELRLSDEMRGWVPVDAVLALRAPRWFP